MTWLEGIQKVDELGEKDEVGERNDSDEISTKSYEPHTSELRSFKVVRLGSVQTPLHSCAEPNSTKFDFGATLERRLIQTACLRRT